MSNGFSKICVVGLGYVGLPTAVTLASKGASVVGLDINPDCVDSINKGAAPIIEADLDGLLNKVVADKSLCATTTPEACDAYLIAVPTPVKSDNRPDLSAVFASVKSIAPTLKKGALVVLESTSPIGTTDEICKIMAELRPDLTFPNQHPETADVMVAFCPERILPGQTLYELIHNDRVVGGVDSKSAEAAKKVYEIFCIGEISVTTAKTAEMVKCTENAFRDVNIAFANELSMICSELGLEVDDVIAMANKHPRVEILRPGCGVGGHCIPIDPWFIIDAAPKQAKLIKTARQVNLAKAEFVADKIARAASASNATSVAVLGLAYKPDVDDLRESPAVQIAEHLSLQHGLNCLLVEPHVEKLPQSLARISSNGLQSLENAIEAADIVVILVAHKAFSSVSGESLNGKTLLDFSGRQT